MIATSSTYLLKINMYKKFWHQLLKNARRYPILTVITIFFIIGASNLFLMLYISSNDDTWFELLDNSGIVIGWISFISAWAFTIRYWMLRKEAETNFRNVGEELEPVREAFDASLILASRNCQPEWHLRHIQPKRVEFIWTSTVEEQVNNLLEIFPNITCIESRNEPLSNEQTYDIKEIKEQCKSFLKHLIIDYPKERICVDLTAGTSIMTIAAFQAAEEMGITSIYLLGNTKKNQIYIIDENNIDDPKEAKVIFLSR